MAENEDDYGYEVSGINRWVAVLHEERADEEGERHAVASDAEDPIEGL